MLSSHARKIVLILAAWSTWFQVAPAWEGFSIYKTDSLDDSLGTKCVRALSAQINCLPYVRSFMQLRYRGPLPLELTKAICDIECMSSLRTWFDSVATACTGKTLGGYPPMTNGGYMWAGWNETCVTDPKPPKAYCNDIIANFTSVPNIQSMPRAELCNTCHVRRLAMMQASSYSIYDTFYKEQLEYVYAQCGVKGPTELPPPLYTAEPEPTPYCVTNKRYTTKEGDTCELISNITSVSSAALYMGNQDLLKDCSGLPAGLSVCIPMTCQTHYVQPKDTCTSIEWSRQIALGSVRKYNSWIDAACTNLQSASAFYGRYVCISPQGGVWSGTIPPPAATPTPGASDGYSKVITPPPNGVQVAVGTTLNCGKWHVVAEGDSCVAIALKNSIEAALFHEINPSLGDGSACDGSLKQQTALCVGPTYTWKTDSAALRG